MRITLAALALAALYTLVAHSQSFVPGGAGPFVPMTGGGGASVPSGGGGGTGTGFHFGYDLSYGSTELF
jgi:hypothetical protein